MQEVLSDADKTASDLVIEEIHSQIILDSSQKQNLNVEEISNPSSDSPGSSIQIEKAESIILPISETNQQSSDTVNNSNIIDSVSTLESKNDYNRTSYILQYTAEKINKKKGIKK